MDSIQNLYSFVKKLPEKAKGISIVELHVEVLDMLFEDTSKRLEKIGKDTIQKFREEYGIILDMEQVKFSYLSSCRLRWRRPEKEEDGYLDGGFSFNGLTDIFSRNLQFWKKSVEEFKEYENEKLIDLKLLKQLRWIESPTIPIEAEYTPQFGCVKLQKGKLPDEFYYYDSGIIYPIPFKSFDEYVDGLVASGSVTCWQYFYVDPELIISKNKEIKYITWSKHTTSRLGGGIDSIHFKPEVKYDRLDLINEYMERCVRLLPESFPFINFTYHKKHYSEFEKLYKKLRK